MIIERFRWQVLEEWKYNCNVKNRYVVFESESGGGGCGTLVTVVCLMCA